MRNPNLLILFVFISTFSIYSDAFGQLANIIHEIDGCTIGVASGSATSDNRPLLWKTRDSPGINNALFYNTSGNFDFIAVIGAGKEDYSWMGVNEKGFAILNSVAYDLDYNTGSDNGIIMSIALGSCATVSDFEHLLDSTNQTGRQTKANFGVIDSTGAAKIIEAAGNQYWIFDANDSIQSPNGYVLRTNFSINGGGAWGLERYNRTVKLVGDFYSGDSLNNKSILRYQMRDFSETSDGMNGIIIPIDYSELYPDVPLGYFDPGGSICNDYSVSASVIHGVLPEEPAMLSTMWTILGNPATSIAVPYWPVGNIPNFSLGNPNAPLCDLSVDIRSELFDYYYVSLYNEYRECINTHKLLDPHGKGIWTRTFPAEDSIFTSTKTIMQEWRQQNLDLDNIISYESEIANYTFNVLQQTYHDLINTTKVDRLSFSGIPLINIFPNPSSGIINITGLTQSTEVKIYTIQGQLVLSKHHVQNQMDISDLDQGIYIVNLIIGEEVVVKKVVKE
jgi:hypothetical protein